MDGTEAAEPNFYLAWYEAFMAQEEARRAAESARRAEVERGVRLLILCLLGWALAAGAAGALALALWTGA